MLFMSLPSLLIRLSSDEVGYCVIQETGFVRTQQVTSLLFFFVPCGPANH